MNDTAAGSSDDAEHAEYLKNQPAGLLDNLLIGLQRPDIAQIAHGDDEADEENEEADACNARTLLGPPHLTRKTNEVHCKAMPNRTSLLPHLSISIGYRRRLEPQYD